MKNKQYSVLEIANCLKPIFEKNKIKKAILFGSYAKGQSNSTSDIDIVVDSRMKGLKFVGLIEEIREALGRNIDLLDISHIEAGSKVDIEIQRTGKLIYEKRTEC